MEITQVTELIERLKKDFNGSTDYHSGVNDGMYHLMHNILLRPDSWQASQPTPALDEQDEKIPLPRKVPVNIDFIKWYSGTGEEKIISAYHKWIKEKNIP